MLDKLKLWFVYWLLPFIGLRKNRAAHTIHLVANSDINHAKALEIQKLAPPDKIDKMINNALVDYKKARIKGIEVLEIKYGRLLTNLNSIRQIYVDHKILPPIKDK